MAGRPCSYNPKKHKKLILDMMSEGASITETAAALGVTRKTFHNWKNNKTNEDLREVISQGLTNSQAYWERLGREMTRGEQKGNIIGWIYTMKCRFRADWAEKIEQKIELSSPVEKMSKTELDSLTISLMGRAKKKL